MTDNSHKNLQSMVNATLIENSTMYSQQKHRIKFEYLHVVSMNSSTSNSVSSKCTGIFCENTWAHPVLFLYG